MDDPRSTDHPGWHLAQANIARMRAPLDEPVMSGFVTQLEAINTAADRAPGFVWRLQTEEGDATGIQAFDDPAIILTLSVWQSIDALHRYVYRSVHAGPFRDRDAWFLPLDRPNLAMWWIPAGRLPTVADVVERLDSIRDHGPGRRAFDFKQRFPAPSGERSTAE